MCVKESNKVGIISVEIVVFRGWQQKARLPMHCMWRHVTAVRQELLAAVTSCEFVTWTAYFPLLTCHRQTDKYIHDYKWVINIGYIQWHVGQTYTRILWVVWFVHAFDCGRHLCRISATISSFVWCTDSWTSHDFADLSRDLWCRHRRNVKYPHFLDWGYRTPTFQDTGEEFSALRGDQITLKPFSAGALPRTPSPESSCLVAYRQA